MKPIEGNSSRYGQDSSRSSRFEDQKKSFVKAGVSVERNLTKEKIGNYAERYRNTPSKIIGYGLSAVNNEPMRPYIKEKYEGNSGSNRTKETNMSNFSESSQGNHLNYHPFPGKIKLFSSDQYMMNSYEDYKVQQTRSDSGVKRGIISDKSDEESVGNNGPFGKRFKYMETFEKNLSSYAKETPSGMAENKISSSFSSGVPRGLVGLKNIGNTCFMNSILQCLLNTPLLSDYFMNKSHLREKNPKSRGLAEAFGSLLEKVKSHTGTNKSYSGGESTYDLKSHISRVNSMFSGYEQHDAQEFLKALLEGINDDLSRVVTKPAYKELTADPKKNIQDISDEWFNYMLARDNSIITDLFCGQLLSKTVCNHCGNESLAFDNFWDLALSFNRAGGGSCNLMEMLEQFLKEEELEDLFYCEKCKVRRKSKKRFVIWRLPKVLVVQLKRFEYNQWRREKINKSVSFPVKNLNLSQFVKESTDMSVRNANYTLYGIVNHGGSLNGGHYTAECMNNENKKWYDFNDSMVDETRMKMDEAASSSPYILFYMKSSGN